MKFAENFQRDAAAPSAAPNLAMLDSIEPHAPGIKEFFSKYNGATFNRGVYRVFPLADLMKWSNLAAEMYPQLKRKLLVFGSTWRGELFALNATRKDGNLYQVSLLDPASWETLGIPATFESFHEAELVEYPNDSLQVELYDQWLATKNEIPKPNECVGYIKPLKLGGVDDIANQEITDLEVYWSFGVQMKQQVEGLPEGTKIDKTN